jgi:3-oxoadipate enol-lactonase
MPKEARETILDRGREAEEGGMEAVVATTLDRWFTPAFRSSPAVEKVRDRLLTDSVFGWAAAWEAITEHDALAGLRRIKVPTLVIAGEKDLATPLEAKQALADAISGARLEVMKGAPHIMQIECEAQFGDLVVDFLDEIRGLHE